MKSNRRVSMRQHNSSTLTRDYEGARYVEGAMYLCITSGVPCLHILGFHYCGIVNAMTAILRCSASGDHVICLRIVIVL